MAERLTVCIDSHLLDNGVMVKEYSLNNNIKLNQFSVMDIPNAVYDKLGELEDVMDEYGIESVEELDKKLQNLILIISTMNDYSITICEELDIALKDFSFIKKQEKDREEIYRNMQQDRDTWKRACELACDAMTKLGGDDCCGCRLNKEMCKICENKKGLIDYFYQQAKKEGDDE